MGATDNDVRQMLDLLTADQPTAPADRAASVRRRVQRRRRNVAAATLAVAVGLSAVGVGVARSGALGGGNGPASGRAVPSWALPWPDHRNGSVPQKVLNGAVLAWRHQSELNTGSWAQTAPTKVIWYAGQTVVHGQVVAVMFEVAAPVGHRLVAGWTTASEVMNGQPAWQNSSSPWVLYDVPAPRSRPDLVIGLNTHGTTYKPDQNPDAWIVALAAPDVRSMAFSAPAGPRPGMTAESFGVGTTSRGLMIGDVGQITGPVQITKLMAGDRNVLPSAVIVGVPGAPASTVPQLARPAPLRLVGFRGEMGELDGQGEVSANNSSGRPQPIRVVVARCFGPAPLRILIGYGDRPHLAGLITCDDAMHVLRYHGPQPRHGNMIWVRTSMLTSYRVAYGP
jgi:hypothetical protein